MGLQKKGLNLNKFKKPIGSSQNNETNGLNPNQNLPRFAKLEKRKNKIIENIENIPSLPSVIFEITKLANSPTSSARDIENKVKGHQVLTAKILKIANSSYYASSNETTTVTKAVTLLGFSALKSIVIASSCSSTLNGDLSIYGYTENGLWKHSLTCATISKEIGKKFFKVSEEYEEELFIAGLIHDIGKIAIAPILKENILELNELTKDPTYNQLKKAEMAIAGIDHAEIGQILIEKWKLSKALRKAVRNHHDDPTSKFEAIIHLADLICNNNQVGITEDYPWKQPIKNELLELLGMTQDNLKNLESYFKKFIDSKSSSLYDAIT